VQKYHTDFIIRSTSFQAFHGDVKHVWDQKELGKRNGMAIVDPGMDENGLGKYMINALRCGRIHQLVYIARSKSLKRDVEQLTRRTCNKKQWCGNPFNVETASLRVFKRTQDYVLVVELTKEITGQVQDQGETSNKRKR
jgi:hypothetical protein